MPIYVETHIRGTLDEVWHLTQTPELHERWDLRFTSISYLPRPNETEPQQFRYATRIGLGIEIEGWGETVGERAEDETRTSALYEGGTRVVALANWPGHIPPGSTVDQPMHVVDMYPTLIKRAGGTLGKNKPLDGVDILPTLTEGKPSRDEVVYDIEPFRAAVREGSWKLVWRATLPSQVELLNLAEDPGEATNLAEKNPQKVAELQQRIEALAREAAAPLIFGDALVAVKPALFGSVVFPGDDKVVEAQP